MGHFLRDERVANLSVNEESLRQISAVLDSRQRAMNADVPEDDKTGKRAILSYIIRFDNKGYRVFSLDDLLRYFNEADEVERVIFTLETGESLRSSRQLGAFVELRIDARDPNSCSLTVTSDEWDWVDSSFCAVRDILVRYKNKNGWVRTAWTQLGVQIIGVTLGFVLSLWAAVKISPKLAIENSFVISFLFVLLVFSNTWTYLNQRMMLFINDVFPNIKFYRSGKDRLHWLMQAVIGGVAIAVTLYILSWIFSFVGDILGGLVEKGG